MKSLNELLIGKKKQIKYLLNANKFVILSTLMKIITKRKVLNKFEQLHSRLYIIS